MSDLGFGYIVKSFEKNLVAFKDRIEAEQGRRDAEKKTAAVLEENSETL